MVCAWSAVTRISVSSRFTDLTTSYEEFRKDWSERKNCANHKVHLDSFLKSESLGKCSHSMAVVVGRVDSPSLAFHVTKELFLGKKIVRF